MREVLSSASEAELAGVFRNAKAACPIRATLEELGHPQPPTVIVTDNTTAAGIANDSVKQKRSKAIDMRFYWIRDRVRQGQFYVHWRRGATNLADCFLSTIQLRTIVQSAPRISTRPLLILRKIILLALTTTTNPSIPRPPLLLVH
jgi:hypothetical protein